MKKTEKVSGLIALIKIAAITSGIEIIEITKETLIRGYYNLMGKSDEYVAKRTARINNLYVC